MSVKSAAADLQAYFHVEVEDIPDRRLYDASKSGMIAVAETWDETMKMRHFDNDASARYHYAARSDKYKASKVRRKNETRDLVFSRETMSAARTKAFGRGYPTRVTLSLPTPSYIKMTPTTRKTGTLPAMGDELTRTTPEEVQLLENVYRDTVEGMIQAYMEGKGNYQGLAKRMADSRGL